MIRLNEGADEFQKIKGEWKAEARNCTLETLPAFLQKITAEYQHDYGTICHAMAMAAIAAAWSVNASPQGGITGFQAGAVMWEFVREWQYPNNKTGLRIIDYDNFLYPQYADKFEKAMPRSAWAALRKAAADRIKDADEDHAKYLTSLDAYNVAIAEFVKKYPDYYERRDHYDPLGIGTGDQWAEEQTKKDSGFEFAPQKPYEPLNEKTRVYQHWVSIVNGNVPFGYVIGTE